MRLHENTKLYRDAIRFTAQQMNLKPEYIEKDYWVTYALFSIFNNEIGRDVIFKGGTSLSKCYQMIDRFSEDIDLVILRRTGETDNKMKSKLKAINMTIQNSLPEVFIDSITNKKGMNRKTAHSYNKEFDGSYGQVRDIIVVESTWLGYHEPYNTMSVSSFVSQMMHRTDQTELAKEYELLPSGNIENITQTTYVSCVDNSSSEKINKFRQRQHKKTVPLRKEAQYIYL